MQAAASAAASAAVAALQQASAGQPCATAIAALLPAAHCSIALDCKIVRSSTRLASGNLLGEGSGTALLAGPSLAALCIKERKAKVLKSLQAASQPFLEDVDAIVAESGCTAIVCLPLLPAAGQAGSSSGSTEGCPCLGALTFGFTSDDHITSASLKAALLLAHALAQEQRAALEELAAVVATLLLPPAGAAGAAGSGGWESEAEEGWEGSDSEVEAAEEGWQGALCQACGACGADGSGGAVGSSNAARRRAGAPAGGGPGSPATQPPPFSPALLSFRGAQQEGAFARYLAQHMQRADLCAYTICFAFFCVEAFLPGTPFFLVHRMGWRCLLGFAGLLPGALLLSRRTQGWFTAHRDLLLALTWASATVWQTSIGNYMHILNRATFRSPLYLQSFGWLPVVGIAFQMRFRFQLAAATLAFAVNSQLLPGICAAFYDDLAPARCLTLGLLRVCLHSMVLPLACCYVFESHARRLFLRAKACGASQPALALPGQRAAHS